MRAKSLQEVVEMCGMNASIYCRIYVDVYEHRVFLLDTRATGGEQKLQLLNNVMPRRYVTKQGILLRMATRNYMSGYISTTTVFHTRNDIAPAQPAYTAPPEVEQPPARLPYFLIAKVGQIAAHDAMKMCKEVYLSVRPCKRGLWAVSMYYATAGMLYNITSYADRALQFPAVSGGRVIVDNVDNFVMRLKRAGINVHMIGDFKCQT